MLNNSVNQLLSFSASYAIPKNESAKPTVPVVTRSHENELSERDQIFITRAAETGLTEVEGGRLAQQKSFSTAIKNFAQKMIDQHKKVNVELRALAANKGLSLSWQPSLEQQNDLKLLEALGEEFDQHYVERLTITAHEDAVKMFKEAVEKTQDKDVKRFVEKNLPTLESHLELAKALQAKLNSEP